MKKISNVEARNIIEAGFPVKALIARNYKPVKNLADLDNLIRLEELGVQHFELYYEPKDTKIPANACKISIVEAVELITNNKEKVYSKLNGKELTFSSCDELISYLKSCLLNGDTGVLYWYAD